MKDATYKSLDMGVDKHKYLRFLAVAFQHLKLIIRICAFDNVHQAKHAIVHLIVIL